MRIAIAVEDSKGLDSITANHFGRCPYYIFVDLDGQQIKKIETLPNPYYGNHQPGAVPGFIHEHNADIIVAGGMGRRAIDLFKEYKVQAYTVAPSNVRQVLEQFTDGNLEDAQPCKEHEGNEGDEDHEHHCA